MTPRDLIRKRIAGPTAGGIALIFIGAIVVILLKNSSWAFLGLAVVLVGVATVWWGARMECPHCLGLLRSVGDHPFRGGAGQLSDRCQFCGLKMDEEWDGVSATGAKPR